MRTIFYGLSLEQAIKALFVMYTRLILGVHYVYSIYFFFYGAN